MDGINLYIEDDELDDVMDALAMTGDERMMAICSRIVKTCVMIVDGEE